MNDRARSLFDAGRSALASPRFTQALTEVAIAVALCMHAVRAFLGWPGALAVLAGLVVLAALSLAGQPERVEWQGILPISLLALVGFMVTSGFWSQYPLATWGGVPYMLAFAFLGLYIALVLIAVFRDAVLGLLGRSGDLTNRVDIWAAVTELALERPWFGWGWVSYWAPWAEPFDGLAVIKGVEYLQAHNAWLDVWLQHGVAGLVVFAVLVVTMLLRTVSWAVDAPLGDVVDSPALRLLPALIGTVLLVQSLAESRLLIEAGWLLLVWLAVASRTHGRALAGIGR